MKIGIVIPTYNSENTIKQTLNSVKNLKNKRFVDIYCVVIDDKSKDKTNLIIQDYIDKEVVDIFIENKKNLGVSETRNIGIKECKNTDYITFLDDDDEIIDSAFNQLNNIVNSDLVFFNFFVNRGNNLQKIKPNVSYNKVDGSISDLEILEYLKKYLIQPNKESLLISSWGKLFRSSIIFDNKIFFNKKMRLFEDVEFNFKFMQHANKLNYINKDLYIHNIPDGRKILDSATMGKYGDIADMFSYTNALHQLNLFLKKKDSKNNYKHLINHCISVYTVISLIRASIRIRSMYSFIKVLKDIRIIFNKNHLVQPFNFYDQNKTNGNFLIPFFIRKKLFFLALLFAVIEGRKRYFK